MPLLGTVLQRTGSREDLSSSIAPTAPRSRCGMSAETNPPGELLVREIRPPSASPDPEPTSLDHRKHMSADAHPSCPALLRPDLPGPRVVDPPLPDPAWACFL